MSSLDYPTYTLSYGNNVYDQTKYLVNTYTPHDFYIVSGDNDRVDSGDYNSYIKGAYIDKFLDGDRTSSANWAAADKKLGYSHFGGVLPQRLSVNKQLLIRLLMKLNTRSYMMKLLLKLLNTTVNTLLHQSLYQLSLNIQVWLITLTLMTSIERSSTKQTLIWMDVGFQAITLKSLMDVKVTLMSVQLLLIKHQVMATKN